MSFDLLPPLLFRCIATTLLLFGPMPTQLATASSTRALVEEMVVVGKRPGPPLWRVSSGNSTLWIFGLPDLLPKRLVWDPTSVSAILQDSQAYLTPPRVSASVSNPFRAIGVLRAFGKLKKLGQGQQLSDVVPAALYQQFTATAAQFRLATRHSKNLRPMYAAQALTDQALARSGLRDNEALLQQVAKIAKRHKVPVVSHAHKIDIHRALQILDSPTLESELICLQITVEAASSDLQHTKLRAQAWADGDAALLKAMDYPDVDSSCVLSLYSSPQAVALQTEANQAWLASAMQVLADNQTSFASLPIRELVQDDGLLRQLEARGYQVRGQ